MGKNGQSTGPNIRNGRTVSRRDFVANAALIPIPGTRTMDHLTENHGAVHVELTPADLREIETASSAIKAHGGRMNEEQMKVVDRTGATL